MTTSYTFLNPSNWNREIVPVSFVEFAENLVKHENDENNGYRKGIEFILLGNFQVTEKRELVANQKTSGLMDVCKVRIFTAEFETVTKIFKNGNKKSYKTRYYVGEEIERLEIGSYYDKRD